VKKIIAGILVCISAATAQAQSIGFLMHDADLVVAGETVSHGNSGRVDLYSLNRYEVIKGSLEQADFRIGCFCDVCCHVHLHSGKGSLLFLRRLESDIDGISLNTPLYTVLHGELGSINYEIEEESTILDLARRYAAIPDDAQAGSKAEAMAEIFKAALRSDSEPLLYSAAYDLIATPGALDQLDAMDESMAIQRFQASGPSSRLRGRMLLVLGEAEPLGFIPLLEEMVRSPTGRFYLEPSAAILGTLGDPGTGYRLVSGFSNLGEIEQGNILYVLGRLGSGKGIAALETLLDDYAEPYCNELVDALIADRSDAAVNVLSQMAGHAEDEVALPALSALGRINSTSARQALQGIASASGDLDETTVNRAARILDELGK